MVRGTVVLPWSGQERESADAIAAGERRTKEANDASTNHVAGEEVHDKMDRSDRSTRRHHGHARHDARHRPLGEVLGPRGLMPNPRDRRITFKSPTHVEEDQEQGGVRFRDFDNQHHPHAPSTRCHFSSESLMHQHPHALINSIVKANHTSEGRSLKRSALSSTIDSNHHRHSPSRRDSQTLRTSLKRSPSGLEAARYRWWWARDDYGRRTLHGDRAIEEQAHRAGAALESTEAPVAGQLLHRLNMHQVTDLAASCEGRAGYRVVDTLGAARDQKAPRSKHSTHDFVGLRRYGVFGRRPGADGEDLTTFANGPLAADRGGDRPAAR